MIDKKKDVYDSVEVVTKIDKKRRFDFYRTLNTNTTRFDRLLNNEKI